MLACLYMLSSLQFCLQNYNFFMIYANIEEKYGILGRKRQNIRTRMCGA